MKERANHGCLVPIIIILILAAVIGGTTIYFKYFHNGAVISTVEDFYSFEQDGDFGSSWELFHSQMKKHFKKAKYIQIRSHVYMQDFDTKTFTFEVGSSTHIKKWRPTEDSPFLRNVYKVPVTQTFHSTFGVFSIKQDVYVSWEKGQWRILWDYH